MRSSSGEEQQEMILKSIREAVWPVLSRWERILHMTGLLLLLPVRGETPKCSDTRVILNYIFVMALLRIFCWALIFILRLRFPPCLPIAVLMCNSRDDQLPVTFQTQTLHSELWAFVWANKRKRSHKHCIKNVVFRKRNSYIYPFAGFKHE